MAKGITVPVVQSGLEASIEAAAKKAGPLTLSATVDPSSFKRLAQPLGRVSGLATEFEKSIAASNARVIAFGASVGIINGVQNAFASLVKTTIEVEKSLTNIAVISGKTTDELQPFSRALFEIAKTTSQSFQTASEAALEFSRQGLSLEETLKRTQDALTLTRFTTLSAAEAVDVLTAAANSFGATGITTGEILNKLVAVDTKFAVSAEDLAKGLSRAGSIAQEVGVNFDELNAIVTIAQERTARGGAVIGNAFKTIFTRIRSEETIQALQSIGIYSFDAEGRLKPVVGLLEELAGKINNLSETKRIEVLEAIASKYNINVLTALVDDLGSTASKFREARDVSAGAQSEAYQRQIELNQTLDAVITRVTNSAAQLADTLGRIGVTDSLKSLLNFFDNILTGINDVVDSEGIGGTIAKGLISGLSGVFFKIGIPLLLAIFVKLTKDIAQFGTESLKTILGINKEVRERQALEQAVVNTLIKDQQVMATILSLSGDRRKQEEYLLSVYNRQLAALQQVQSIAAGVAPALQAAGLSATSGTIKKRAAGGYLPAEEAKDVRRGVGGASPSSKVVEIPNFSFGGGKRGTMVANTSEYIVPNYAGGTGTAIFNQDMAKEYGLPPGAKKITASGGFVPASGFVPNFAEKQPKNIKAIRQGKKFEESLNLKFFGEKSYADNAVLDFPKPKGFGADNETKNALGMDPMSEYGDAKRTQNRKSEKSLLDKYLRTPEGKQEFLNATEIGRNINLNPSGLSMLFLMEGQDAKKVASATTEDSVWSKSTKNLFKDKFGETRSVKTITMPYIADKINKDALQSTRAANGYIPNFVELNDKGIYAGLVGETASGDQPDVQKITKYVTPSEKGLDIYDTGIKSADSVTFDVYKVPRKNESQLKLMRQVLQNTGKNLAIDFAREVTGGALGNNVAGEKLAQTFNPGSLQSFANTIFEASVGALLSDKSFQDYTEQSTTSLFDLNIAGNSLIKKNFGIKDSVNALEVKGASTPKLLNSIAEKIYKATAGGQEAFTKRGKVYIEDPGRANNKSIARAFVQGGIPFVEIKPDVFQPTKGEFDASKYKLLKNPPGAYKTAASGYIPNYVGESKDQQYDAGLELSINKAAQRAYGDFSKKKITAGVSRGQIAGQPATRKFREQLDSTASISDFIGFQAATAGVPRPNNDLASLKFFNRDINGPRPALRAVTQNPSENEPLAPAGQFYDLKTALTFAKAATVSLQPSLAVAKKGASGYVPNFADNDPLKEAIGREISAGVPPARVRVTQDGRLKNRDNPDGLAVINTRDEPNGKIPNDFRERGMRAAMASRGFVPNFAEENAGVNVRGIFSGKTKKFDDKIDQLANATNDALLEYKQNKISLEQLNEKINASKAQLAELAKAQKLSADVEKKYAERVDQGIKKINERNKNSGTGAANSAQPPILPTSKKDVDLGKFLVLQSAIVGLTSAFQSATEQGSAAANALEGVSAVASGIATFAAIGTTLSPQLRLLAAGVTALASAFPLLSRLYEDFKDPAEKTAEALAKLGKEAERTGKKISPEEFLAAFQQQEAKTKEEQTRKNVTAQIQSALGAEGVSLNETDLYSIYAGLSASGSIGADQKVDPKVIKDLLAPAINKEPSVAQRAKRLSAQDVVNIGIGGLQFGGLFGEAVSAARGRVGPIAQSVSKVGANTLDTKTANQAIQERVLQKQLETARKPQTEQRTEKAVNTENELLKIKFGILDGLLKKELEINKVYADRIRGIASLNTNLERSQTIATEQRYSEIQASLERKKVQAEESKGISENINNLKSSLSGLQDKGLGNIFGEIDTDKVRGLMQAFQSGGVGSDAFKKAFEESTSRVENGQAVAGVNLDQFDPKTREQVFKTLYDAVSNESKLRANSANRIADIDQAQKDFLPSAKRLTNETDQLNAIIAGTPFFVQKLNETFSGAEKYQELLNTEQAKLANSFAKQILQNKITLDSAKQSFEIETKLLQAKLDLEQGIRDRIPIEQRAAKDAIELNRSTLERIDQLKKDAINAPKRLQSQKDILSAETGVIESENAVGGGEVDLEKVLILRRNSIAKLAQSERAAEEETRSNIGMIRKKVDADRASVDRQTRTIEAEEDLYKNGIDLTNVISIRRSMVAKLVQSERKAEEETLASIGMMRQKMDAERAAIDRQTRLTEEENRIYNSNDKDLNIAALRRSTLAKLEQSERKAEEENQAAIKTVNEKYKADLDGIKRQAELTEAQNAAVDASKQSTAVALGLRLARAKLVESERKAEEENQIAIRMIGESYQADINSTKRKIEYAQALIGQIDAAKMNEKVTGEMTLETMNLITSLKEAQAKFNNIDIEVGNEALRTRTNVLGETSSTISRGLALSNLRIGGELETQAFAQVAEQRRAGRKAEDISTSELYDISKGRNLSVRQGLSIQKAALLDEAQTFQDIIGKSTPKLFADGMAEAMQAAMNQADDLGGALRNVALNFLKSLQSAFLQNASRQIVASILPNAAPAGMRQGGYVKGYASGGLVTGGSGYKDDVPAMLSAGEYVIRKSSVEKYGAHNLNKLNSGEPPKFASGGIFLPGIRGQGQISGYKDLTAFANQTTTSGATDVLAGGASTAFASLEDQSSRLSAYALMNEDDTINQEIRSAQEQARNIMAEREAYRTAERKAFQKQLVGTVASAALSFGIGKATGALFGPKPGVDVPNLGFNSADVASKITQPPIPTPNMLPAPIRTTSTSFGDFMSPARAQAPSYSSLLSMFQPQGQYPVLQGSSPFAMPRPPGRAYGGVVKRYSAGGGPTDDIPALLMGGEYVMSRKATQNYGKQFFDAINQGRAPRFADGGQVSTSEPSFAEKAASSSDSKGSSATNVSININVTGGTSESQSQGDTKQGGIDYKKMSEQIKQIVITTINEEKRLGGSLRSR